MGVFTYEFEINSLVSPARLFKSAVVEPDKVLPKASPQAITKVELEGNGGVPGTIIKINFAEDAGIPVKYVKHKIEVVDKDNLSYSYSVIEGGLLALDDKLEKMSYDNKFVAAANGGTVFKSSVKYHTIGDGVYTEDEHKAHIEMTEGFYKAVEAYLMANPDVCN